MRRRRSTSSIKCPQNTQPDGAVRDDAIWEKDGPLTVVRQDTRVQNVQGYLCRFFWSEDAVRVFARCRRPFGLLSSVSGVPCSAPAHTLKRSVQGVADPPADVQLS